MLPVVFEEFEPVLFFVFDLFFVFAIFFLFTIIVNW